MPAQRPNIIYILADDLGWGDLPCYNPESRVPMPHADGLAQQGVRFTDMHSPSSVCTPTRYGILTGRYAWRTRLNKGVLTGYSPNLIEPGRTTVASLLKDQGYDTAGVGKWHLGLGNQAAVDFDKPLRPGPLDHGFDYYYGIPASLDMDPYLYFENDRVVERATAHTAGKNAPRGVFWREGAIAPSFQIDQVLPTLTRKATSLIAARAQRANPFFLYLALSGPHTPWMPLPEFQGKSKAGLYGDFVTQIDDTLGRVLKAIDDARIADNTLVIFTSDNGAHWTPQDKAQFPHRANANWHGMKADIYDAGHRIPFLARWPGKIAPNTVRSDLGCLTDLMATVAEITGARVRDAAGEDSFSLWPAMQGREGRRSSVIHHSSEGLFAARQGRWKANFGRGSGGFSDPKTIAPGPGEPEGELYDLVTDPGETENVWQQNPDVAIQLRALLAEVQRAGRSRPRD